MCLAVPVRIVSIDGDEAETEIAGVRRRVSIVFTPEAKLGDYVLLHT
ncbi:MAG TPA: HypC/HybG/HupF family hydrogenase formation chaperone, partial [Dehalococcoidia bacterium]|nr:HypC/HybG/HupF family hydrogenase formation chaperone [Dehalococcoidia bacterium]